MICVLRVCEDVEDENNCLPNRTATSTSTSTLTRRSVIVGTFSCYISSYHCRCRYRCIKIYCPPISALVTYQSPFTLLSSFSLPPLFSLSLTYPLPFSWHVTSIHTHLLFHPFHFFNITFVIIINLISISISILKISHITHSTSLINVSYHPCQYE